MTHAMVVRKNWRRGTNLGAHVTDGGHARAWDGVDTRAEVLNNGTGAALDCQDVGDLQDDVLGRRPAAQLASQVHANNLQFYDILDHLMLTSAHGVKHDKIRRDKIHKSFDWCNINYLCHNILN